MVPIKEMTDVMRVVKDKVRMKEGTWVRMKRGLYKDDLAQVDFVDPSEHKIRLKLIPRIDYKRMRGVMRNQNSVSTIRVSSPPPLLSCHYFQLGSLASIDLSLTLLGLSAVIYVSSEDIICHGIRLLMNT